MYIYIYIYIYIHVYNIMCICIYVSSMRRAHGGFKPVPLEMASESISNGSQTE